MITSNYGRVGLVEPKFAFLNIGFDKMYCQFRNQHYENWSYATVFVHLKKCIALEREGLV